MFSGLVVFVAVFMEDISSVLYFTNIRHLFQHVQKSKLKYMGIRNAFSSNKIYTFGYFNCSQFSISLKQQNYLFGYQI